MVTSVIFQELGILTWCSYWLYTVAAILENILFDSPLPHCWLFLFILSVCGEGDGVCGEGDGFVCMWGWWWCVWVCVCVCVCVCLFGLCGKFWWLRSLDFGLFFLCENVYCLFFFLCFMLRKTQIPCVQNRFFLFKQALVEFLNL